MLRQDKVFELMIIYCDGNYNRFARELNVDVSHLHNFIKYGIGGGKKIIQAIMRFCYKNNLDIREYLII